MIGMFVAHAIPRMDAAELIVDGRSSILFATLAGVSLGLITGGDRPLPRGDRRATVLGILIRAAGIFVLGALLLLLDSEIAIILDYYGIMFVVLIPLLFLRRWVLAIVAAILAVAVPGFAATLPPVSSSGLDVGGAIQDYLFTGYYPALVWLPFLIVGLLCARSGLGRRGTPAAMIVGGSAAAVIGYTVGAVVPGATAAAHSGGTAELVGSGGVAVAIIGLTVWVTGGWRTGGSRTGGSRAGSEMAGPERGAVARGIRLAASPLAATGSMALTVYVLQIIVLAAAVALRDVGLIDYPGWPLLIGLVVGALVLPSLWRRLAGRGPLERMLASLSRLPVRA